VSLVEEFFQAIDRAWSGDAGAKVRLSVIGSGALMLQVRYERGTKDSDVLETTDLSAETKARLVSIAGPGTPLHQQWKLYLDVVGNGIPFLPSGARWHPLRALNAELENIELHVLDVVDVVVSKLKRFNANDQADIDAMIQRGLVPHDELVARFCSAVDVFIYDARASDLPKYIEHLHRVERDMLDADETEIELPSWA
jgi:hypothetical protein